MNINDAKNIPIEKLVEELGGRYSKTDRNGNMWFFSPFRPDEKTASFKINAKQNTWHDFGLSGTFAHQKQNNGGDILDLWCEYNLKDRRAGIKEALDALKKFAKPETLNEPINRINNKTKPVPTPNQQPRYKILKIADRITFPGLKDELYRRRISLVMANLYLKQGYILDTVSQKKYNGFLFENDQGGYEVSIPNPNLKQCFKTCIGPKASTRLLANEEQNSADVFEGFWDFLSWLELKGIQRPINHSYILNSVSLVAETCAKIIAFKETIRYVFLFMDNDEAGFLATHAIAQNLTDQDLKVGSFDQFYSGSKDLNEFWANGLKPS